MDLRQLRYFVGVAEAGSFAHAAKRLNVSQPALSRRVGELEQSLGSTLFHRSSRGVELTEVGDRLIGHAKQILDSVEAARKACSSAPSPRILLSLGATPTPSLTLLPEILKRGSDVDNPPYVRASQGSSRELFSFLRDGSIDAALTYQKPRRDLNDAITEPLYSDELYVIGSPAIIGQTPEPIAFRALGSIPLVVDPRSYITRQMIERGASKLGIKFDIRAEIEPSALQSEVIQREPWATVAPFSFFATARNGQSPLNARKLTGPSVNLTLNLIHLPSLSSEKRRIISTLGRTAADALILDGRYRWSRPSRDGLQFEASQTWP